MLISKKMKVYTNRSSLNIIFLTQDILMICFIYEIEGYQPKNMKLGNHEIAPYLCILPFKNMVFYQLLFWDIVELTSM